MNCPYCNTKDAKVIDSRGIDSGGIIRRRRECLNCKKRFTSYERVERSERLAVIKKDGSRVPFDGEKILKGIQAACGKRAVSEEVKQRVADEVDDAVHREFDREVPSLVIGKRVAMALRDVDAVAYVRFASVYYDFQSVSEFQAEISDLSEKPPSTPNQPLLFDHKTPPTV